MKPPADSGCGKTSFLRGDGVFGDEAKVEPTVSTVDAKALDAEIRDLTLENDVSRTCVSRQR